MAKQVNHMSLRGSIYYVRLDVPKDLREHYGSSYVLTKSLRTSDKRLATEKRDKLIAQWKAEFRGLRAERELEKERHSDWREPLAEEAKILKREFDATSLNIFRAGEMPEKQIFLQAKDLNSPKPSISELYGKPEGGVVTVKYDKKEFLNSQEIRRQMILKGKYYFGEYDLTEKEIEEASSIIKNPDTYKPKSPITFHMIQEWRIFLDTQLDNKKTNDAHVSRIKKLSQWLPREGRKIDFDSIALFIKSISIKRQTQKGYVGSGRNFWEWATRNNPRFREQFSDKPNPFDGHTLPKNNASSKESYKPFSVQEVEQLYREATKKGDSSLAYLIAFGAYTGARIGELGRISKDTTEIKNNIPISFRIEEAKTKAGVREVPIHSDLIPLYKHLLEQSHLNGGYLFASGKNQYGQRLDALGKRFGRLKDALGFSKDHVFHSIRKTTITQMHIAGVPALEVVSYLVGHETGVITLDTYSAGASMEQKRDAIEKLNYSFDLRIK